MNYKQLHNLLPNETAAVQYCVSVGLLKDCIECPHHQGEIIYCKIRNGRQFKWAYRCNRAKTWYSIKKDTFFDHCNMPLDTALFVIYHWLKGDDQKQSSHETGIAAQTCSNWVATLRDVCVLQMETELAANKIGGPGLTVEIDESHLFKRKYERGRVHATSQWVLGGICRETKATFIVPVVRRSANDLIPIITAHVHSGTHIITDGWPAYITLPDYGYQHSVVIHSENFVDPNTGAHTNLIENLWKWLKGSMPMTGTTQFKLQGHLYEFLRKRKYNRNRDGFDALIQQMANLFAGR